MQKNLRLLLQDIEVAIAKHIVVGIVKHFEVDIAKFSDCYGKTCCGFYCKILRLLLQNMLRLLSQNIDFAISR